LNLRKLFVQRYCQPNQLFPEYKDKYNEDSQDYNHPGHPQTFVIMHFPTALPLPANLLMQI